MRSEDLHEDDWREEAPLLASLSKAAEPEVPEGYFEGISPQVLARVRSLQQTEAVDEGPPRLRPDGVSKRKIMGFRRTMFWRVAAGIALLATVGTVYLLRSHPILEGTPPEAVQSETLLQLASLAPEDIARQLDVSDLSDEQLFEALGAEASAAFGHEVQGVRHDEAVEYLKGTDLDGIDWQDLDLDLSEL